MNVSTHIDVPAAHAFSYKPITGTGVAEISAFVYTPGMGKHRNSVDMSDWIETHPEEYAGHRAYMRIYSQRNYRARMAERDKMREELEWRRSRDAKLGERFDESMRKPTRSLKDALIDNPTHKPVVDNDHQSE